MFDNTAVARDGTLEAGDEIVGVGGESVKGRSKVEVAKMIQASVRFIKYKYEPNLLVQLDLYARQN